MVPSQKICDGQYYSHRIIIHLYTHSHYIAHTQTLMYRSTTHTHTHTNTHTYTHNTYTTFTIVHTYIMMRAHTYTHVHYT